MSPHPLCGDLTAERVQRGTFVWLPWMDADARPLVVLGQISRLDPATGTFRVRRLDDLDETYREFPIDPHGPQNTPDAGRRRLMLMATADEAARYLDHQEFLRAATTRWHPGALDDYGVRRERLNLP